MSLKFALIGAAGYVAPRHMQAIRDVGGELTAVLDPHDSVGVLDKYFPRCLYFREPERFERWFYKNPVDYVSVCSPNYLHDAHCMMAMRNGADVICEKPVTLTEKNLDSLCQVEQDTGKRINAVLQCRLHPAAVAAKKKYVSCRNVVVDYITPRGRWYDYSWKGDVSKSGGVITNIGVHLFDLCVYLFGKFEGLFPDSSIELERAAVQWHLSTKGDKVKRTFLINDEFVDLSNGFNNLHTDLYANILNGKGFGLEDARQAIRIVERLR